MFTRHGHHIEGTTGVAKPEGMEVARCGGPGLCPGCSTDATQAVLEKTPWHEDILCWNEGTIGKVRGALYQAGLTQSECTNAIEYMQAAGVKFRENLPYM